MINGVLSKKYVAILPVTAVFIIAVFFRTYKLSSIPFGLNNDAAWEGLAALDMLRGNISPYVPYATEGWRGEAIIRVIVAFLMTFMGNNPITIRIASTIFGVGLIIPVYLLIKNLFSKRLALLTSFFVAISGWHIIMSRTGWRAIALPFFSTLSFYFFYRGLKTKKVSDFIWCGISLSIGSLYIYDAARILPFFFITWVLFLILTTEKFLYNYKRYLLVLTVSFLIMSLPMVYYALGHWQNFTSRSEFLFIGRQIKQTGSLSPLWNNILTSAGLFNVKANGNDFFIFEPLLDKPVSWIFPIGFLIAIVQAIRLRSKNYAFILLWFLVSLLPGILSVPNGNRGIGTIPSVYFFAALGLLIPLDYITSFLKTGRKLVMMCVILGFCIYAISITYKEYLGPERREMFGFYPEIYIAGKYINTIQDKYDLYLSGNYPPELQLYYLYKDTDPSPFIKKATWVGMDSSHVLGISSAKNKGMAFFMPPVDQNEGIANSLLLQFPTAKKFYLWYKNDNIDRPASIVVLIPPQ